MIERPRRWEDNAMDMKLSPEQLKLRSAARELAEAEFAAKAAEIDRTEAYPFDNVAALKAAGDLNGKVVIDITNPLTPDYMRLTIGHTTSAAEEIAKMRQKLLSSKPSTRCLPRC